jgi:hypothetical protein
LVTGTNQCVLKLRLFPGLKICDWEKSKIKSEDIDYVWEFSQKYILNSETLLPSINVFEIY